MEYRNCTLTDLKKCAEILALAYALPPYNEKWEREHAYKYLARFYDFDPELCFVAELNGNIVGAIFSYSYPWHAGESCYIQEIFVSPSSHRKGVGRGLIEKLSSVKGAGSTWLVANENAKAVEFYESLGFSNKGSYKFYSGSI